jgi:hypothetical protein
MNRVKNALLLLTLGCLVAGEVALFRNQALQKQYNADVANTLGTMAHYIVYKLGGPGDE